MRCKNPATSSTGIDEHRIRISWMYANVLIGISHEILLILLPIVDYRWDMKDNIHTLTHTITNICIHIPEPRDSWLLTTLHDTTESSYDWCDLLATLESWIRHRFHSMYQALQSTSVTYFSISCSHLKHNPKMSLCYPLPVFLAISAILRHRKSSLKKNTMKTSTNKSNKQIYVKNLSWKLPKLMPQLRWSKLCCGCALQLPKT